MFILEQSGEDNATQPFDLRDRGLLLADGIFDTSLIVRGRMVLGESHINRLVRDAAALDISIDAQEINTRLDMALTEDHNGILRITVTRGPAERGIAGDQRVLPTLLFSLSPLNSKVQFTPLALQTSPIRRNASSPTSRHKTLSYTDNTLAFRAARAAGFDDALFLNTSNDVCCTSIGNLFVKSGDAWLTPPISDGVLPGVMREWVMRQGKELSLDIIERSITQGDLENAEAAFMTNSVRLAAPISRIDTHDLAPSLPTGLKEAMQTLARTI